MKKHIITTIFVCTTLLLQSQDRLSLLINLTQSSNNFTYYEVVGGPITDVVQEAIILPANDQYGISIRKSRSSGVFFETMFAGAVYKRSITSNRSLNPQMEQESILKSRNIDLRLRLEIGKSIAFERFPNLFFGLSTSCDPRFSFSEFQSLSSSIFPANIFNIEFGFFANPQIEYSINQRINFQVKMPLQVLTISNLFVHHRNPNNPFEEQSSSHQLVDIFTLRPNYSFGVGYYLAHQERKSQISHPHLL